MSRKNSSTYRTIDLVKAAGFGWAQHKKLSLTEYQILEFIALRGKTNEPTAAFAWFPKHGQEWWAEIMMIPFSSLRKALSSLRKKNLIVNIDNAIDNRFFNVKGYGIPEHVMEECLGWYTDRQNMVYTQVPNTIEELVKNPYDVKYSHTDVNTVHMHVKYSHMGNALTSTFAPYTQLDTRRDTHLLTDSSRPSVAPTLSDGESMRYEDEWSTPKESDDFSVPKESKQKTKRAPGPSMRLTIKFQDCWMKSRESRLNLPVHWSVQRVFMNRLNALLTEHSEAEVEGMMDAFFRLIDSGQLSPKSDELWKDFLYNKGRLYKIFVQSSERVVSVDEKTELEKFREKLNR